MKLADLTVAPPREYVPAEYRDALSRRWAHAHGYFGAAGGWIYRGESQEAVTRGQGRSLCQGWGVFWTYFKARILDDLTRDLTAMGSFQELTHPASPTYRPTLLVLKPQDWKTDALADAYDQAMAAQRDPRRAYRGKGRDGMAPKPARPASAWLGFVAAGVTHRRGW
jgi:hypothetical protein